MATATLSLFPSPSLKNKSSPKGGHRNVQCSAKELDFEMVKMSASTQGVVIAIHETPAPNLTRGISEEPESASPSRQQHSLPSIVLTAPPKPQGTSQQSPSTTSRPRTPSPKRTQAEFTSKSGSPPNSLSRSRPPSPLQLEASPRSQASSHTLVRKGSNASTRTATHSPIMRSMFPRYDPSIPLGRQQYHPSTNGRVSPDIQEHMYSPSLYSEPKRQSSRPSAPPLVIPASSGSVLILQEAHHGRVTTALSTPDELLPLWDIANGQGRDGAKDAFRVELGCDSLNNGSETISFASLSQALYTLSASANALVISRTHPLHPTPTIQICHTNLSTPTPTSPLIATIFPTLAELMALDQSSSIAVSHRLPRHTSAELQSEAISRAQQNEASNLLWDSDSGKYYLIHPTLLDNASTTFPIEITPAEEIVISAPETNGATPLLRLCLSEKRLEIFAEAIGALPSLYMLDTLVTALLTLLLHLHRSSSSTNTNHISSIMQIRDAATLPTFPPPPTLLTLSARKKKRTLSTWSRSVFSRPQEQRDLEANITTDTQTAIITETGTGTEEHDWTFQPLVNTDDDSLPAATRAVIRTLYWGFQVFVWVLGVGVNLIAAGVAGLGRVGRRA